MWTSRLTRPTWMRSWPRSEPIYGLSWHDPAPPLVERGRTSALRRGRSRLTVAGSRTGRIMGLLLTRGV